MWFLRKRKKTEKDTIAGELWEYNFSHRKRNRFELEDSASFSSSIKNRALCLETRKRDVFVWSVSSLYRYRDFVLDADLEIADENGHSSAGFIFRYANDRNYYNLLVSDSGHYRLDVVFNGTPRILIPWTDFEGEAERRMNLRIIAHSQFLAFFINGNWIGEIEDDTVDAGYIAFAAQNFSEKESAEFYLHDIKIESRPVEVEVLFYRHVKNGISSEANRKKLAERLYETGQYGASLVQLKKVLKTSPADRESIILAGRCFSRLGSGKEALEAFDLAEESSENPEKEIVIEKSGVLYRMNRLLELKNYLDSCGSIRDSDAFLLNMAGNTEDGLGNFKEALHYYEKASLLDSENGFYLLNEARTLEKTGSRESAFEKYHQAALCFFRSEDYADMMQILPDLNRLSPGNREARILEGKVLFAEGNLNEAFGIFNSLIDEGCTESSVQFLYGIILNGRGQKEEALGFFKSAAESEPEFPVYWFRYAESLFLNGKNAGEAVERAAELDPGNPWVFNLYGQILMASGEYGEAVSKLGTAHKLDSEAIDILINYSEALSHSEGYDSAADLLSGHQDEPAVQNQLGNISCNAGDFESAISCYRSAVKGEPDNRIFRENLSSALVKTDHIHEAEEILAGLIEEGGGPSVFEKMAWVAFRKGEYKRADTAFREALKLDPDNPEILLSYGEFLLIRQDFKNAGRAADKVMKNEAGSYSRKKAEDLLLRVKKAANTLHQCSACGREWWVPVDIPVIKVLRLRGEPERESPAGKCPSCGRVFCVECAMDYLTDNRFMCPDCNEPLKLSENYLKYLASFYAEKQNP